MWPSRYQGKLLYIAVCLSCLGVLHSLSSRIKARFHSREVIQSIANFSNLEIVINDDSAAVKNLYTDILNELKIYKLPNGYTLKKLTLSSSAGIYDILSTNKNDSARIQLQGDARISIQVYNETFGVYAESVNDITKNGSDLWQLSTSIITFSHVDTFKIVLWVLNFLLIASVLVFYRNAYSWALALSGLVYTLFEYCSCNRQFNDARLLEYARLVACGCMLVCYCLFYKIQADSLKKHNQIHSAFMDIFLNLPCLVISIALTVFNHNPFAHGALLLIWAPIFQCMVLETFGKIYHTTNVKLESFNFVQLFKGRKKTGVEAIDKGTQGDGQPQDGSKPRVTFNQELPPIEEIKIIQQMSLKQRGKKYIKPWNILLMTTHVALMVIFLTIGFKKKNSEDIAKSVYNQIKEPFYVDNQVIFSMANFAVVPDDSGDKYEFNLLQQGATVEFDTFGYISSSDALAVWLQSNLTCDKFGRSLAIIGTPTTFIRDAHVVTSTNIAAVTKAISDFNIWCFFLYYISDKELAIAKVNFNRTVLQVLRPYLNVHLIKMSMEYAMVAFSGSCIVILVFMCWLNYRQNFTPFKFALVIVMLLLNVSVFVIVTFIEPVLVSKLRSLLPLLELPVPPSSGMSRFPTISLVFGACKRACDVISFLNIVAMIFYVLACLPKYYSNFTSNGTLVKRRLKMDPNLLHPILFQYGVLLVGVSIIGNKLFGITMDPFKSFWLVAKSIFILNFNKIPTREKSSVLNAVYIYNRIAVLVFYYIALTFFCAVIYYSSLPQSALKSTLMVVDKPEDDFQVDIKASLDEIIRFKVFVKALQDYRKLVAANPQLGQKDPSQEFFANFPTYNPGLSILNPVNRTSLYSERIKRQVLCIVFLRLKIASYAAKQEALEQEERQQTDNQSSDLGYLRLLEQRVLAQQYQILRINCNKEIGAEPVSAFAQNGNLQGGADQSLQDSDLDLYDIDDLEQLIWGPYAKLPKQTTASDSDGLSVDMAENEQYMEQMAKVQDRIDESNVEITNEIQRQLESLGLPGNDSNVPIEGTGETWIKTEAPYVQVEAEKPGGNENDANESAEVFKGEPPPSALVKADDKETITKDVAVGNVGASNIRQPNVAVKIGIFEEPILKRRGNKRR